MPSAISAVQSSHLQSVILVNQHSQLWHGGAPLADVPQQRMKTPKQGPALATNKRGRNSIDGDGGAPPTKKQGRAAHAAAGAASKGSGTDRAAAAHPSASKGRSGSHAIEAAQRRIWAPNVRSGKRDVGVVGDGACHGGDGVSVTPVVELARWMKMKKLRQKLHKLCSRAGQQVPRVRASVQSKRVQTGPYAHITCVFRVRVRLCVCLLARWRAVRMFSGPIPYAREGGQGRRG